MRHEPPRELIERLERLDLATAEQVRQVHRRAASLARHLPLFESVWIDALVQTRLLTAYQASELNAGRGEQLAVGPYLLCQPLDALGYATCYLARPRGARQWVHLTVAESDAASPSATLEPLQALVGHRDELRGLPLCPVEQAGLDGRRLWMVSNYQGGRTAREWMVSNGRFPPEAALEIARQMLVGLDRLHRAGLCHGDLRASGLLLTDQGEVALSPPGLRGLLRPEEGFAFADLMPEAYDYLAPERVSEGTPPTVASDLYACGCLWWHLLAGRPPLVGGDSLARLRAAQTATIPEIRTLAPETPTPLAAAIAAATQRDPRLRTASAAALIAALGPPTRVGRTTLTRCLHRQGEPADRWAAPARPRWRRPPVWLTVVAAGLVILGWSLRPKAPSAEPPARNVAAADRPLAKERSPLASLPQAADASRRPKSPVVQAAAGPPRLLLPSGAVTIDSGSLRAGQTITGEPGARPLMVVPAAGLLLAQENLTFENIDFVWQAAAEAASQTPAAMFHVQAARIAFRGCSFRAARPEGPLPLGIDWTLPLDRAKLDVSLPSGELRLADCVFRHVAAGLGCQVRGTGAVHVSNTLYLGRGPLVRLSDWPAADETLLLRLSGLTLRHSGPLLECPTARGEPKPGRVTIVADGCVLAPARATPLIQLLHTAPSPESLTRLEWSGQGSLVAPETPILEWQEAPGTSHPIDDGAVAIAGLVRSEVEFAGPAEQGPEGSRVVRWQVPLPSAAAPGIHPEPLHEPRR